MMMTGAANDQGAPHKVESIMQKAEWIFFFCHRNNADHLTTSFLSPAQTICLRSLLYLAAVQPVL